MTLQHLCQCHKSLRVYVSATQCRPTALTHLRQRGQMGYTLTYKLHVLLKITND